MNDVNDECSKRGTKKIIPRFQSALKTSKYGAVSSFLSNVINNSRLSFEAEIDQFGDPVTTRWSSKMVILT